VKIRSPATFDFCNTIVGKGDIARRPPDVPYVTR
jgi:hypothetical protein